MAAVRARQLRVGAHGRRPGDADDRAARGEYLLAPGGRGGAPPFLIARPAQVRVRRRSCSTQTRPKIWLNKPEKYVPPTPAPMRRPPAELVRVREGFLATARARIHSWTLPSPVPYRRRTRSSTCRARSSSSFSSTHRPCPCRQTYRSPTRDTRLRTPSTITCSLANGPGSSERWIESVARG